jgi:hypothetical protein
MTIDINVPNPLLSAYPELQNGILAVPADAPRPGELTVWDVLLVSPVHGRPLWQESKFIPYAIRFTVNNGTVTDAQLVATDDTGLTGSDITGRKSQLIAVGQAIWNAGGTEPITITFS